jgi:hypothetical protein
MAKPDIQTQLNAVVERRPWGLCDPEWQYVPSAQTDVQSTWRKYGWTPTRPNEHEVYTPTDYNKQEQHNETIRTKD